MDNIVTNIVIIILCISIVINNILICKISKKHQNIIDDVIKNSDEITNVNYRLIKFIEKENNINLLKTEQNE